MSLILKNGRILDPSSGIDRIGDLFVDGDKLSEHFPIGLNVEIIDVKGCWVCPGLIDVHVHLREPGQEQKEDIASGLAAAAHGGFTAVVSMPNTSPPNDSPVITKMMTEKAAALKGTRLYPAAAATKLRKGEELSDMRALVEAGAAAFSDDGSAVVDDEVMSKVLSLCAELKIPFSQHAEDPDIVKGGVLHDGEIAKKLGVKGWPAEGEDRIIRRDIALAEKLGVAVHFAHVSTMGAIEAIATAKKKGVKVTAEVTPHHLLLTDETAVTKGTLAKVNPPLRSEEHRRACAEALSQGILDIVATDHAPHTVSDKEGGFDKAAFGMIGLETAVPLLLDLVKQGLLSPLRMIEAMSTLPARIFNIQGGTLAPGSVADVTVIDPDSPFVIDPEDSCSKSRNTPFAGYVVPGRAVMTVVGGSVVFRSKDRI